jgi:response regulator NasT
MSYRVMLVDEKPERLSFISDKLDGDGCRVVACVRPDDELLSLVKKFDPEVIIIDLDSPNRDTLENLRSVQNTTPRPMLLFTQEDGGEMIREALESGVSAYIVDGLHTRNVRPVVEAAMVRFRQFRALEKELCDARRHLQERKRVERAKGIIMQQKGLSEPEAYDLLRKAAMTRNQRLVEIADSIITAHEMLAAIP